MIHTLKYSDIAPNSQQYFEMLLDKLEENKRACGFKESTNYMYILSLVDKSLKRLSQLCIPNYDDNYIVYIYPDKEMMKLIPKDFYKQIEFQACPICSTMTSENNVRVCASCEKHVCLSCSSRILKMAGNVNRCAHCKNRVVLIG